MSSLRIPDGEPDHVQGDLAAPITLVEYDDYECPHCGAAHPAVKQLQERFGDSLRFVFRNFPIAEIHRHAVTAEFDAANGGYWKVHDALFENQRRLETAVYESIVAGLHLAAADLHAALENNLFEDKISADFNGDVRSGVNCTPSFFINGQRYNGPPDVQTLAEVLEEAIAAAR